MRIGGGVCRAGYRPRSTSGANAVPTPIAMAASLWSPSPLGASGPGDLVGQRDPERVAIPGLLLDGRLDVARVLRGRSSRDAGVGRARSRRRDVRRHACSRAPESARSPRDRAGARPCDRAALATYRSCLVDRTNPPWGRILFAPLPLFHPGVTRISNLSYGDAGRRNRLDLYRRRRGGSGGPVLIHLHGGGFSFAPGRKSFYARRLLFRLARQGWVCISATYRLQPAATSPTR